MKRAVAAVVVVAVVVAGGVIAWSVAGVEGLVAAAGGDPGEIDAAAVGREFFSDLDAVDAVAAFARVEGDDAGAVLNAKVPWKVLGQAVRPLPLDDKLKAVAAHNDKWLSLVDEGVVDRVDTSLLRGLRGARWDLGEHLPPDVPRGQTVFEAPVPDFPALRQLARLHLVKALGSDAVVPFADAARDVEALAHLCATTGVLGGVVGAVLYKDVALAHDVAVARGKAGDHVVVATVADAERLRRVVLAAPAFLGVDDVDTQRVLRSPSVVVCAAWPEALLRDQILAPLNVDGAVAAPAWRDDRFARSCGLSTTKTLAPPSMCTPELGTSCTTQLAIVRALPPLRARLHARALAAVRATFFGGYGAATTTNATTTNAATTTTTTTTTTNAATTTTTTTTTTNATTTNAATTTTTTNATNAVNAPNATNAPVTTPP